MRLIFLPGWYKRLPRLVRRRVRATIYRAPVDRVVLPEQNYFDSRQVYAAGIVRDRIAYMVFGARDRAHVLEAAWRALKLAPEHHEFMRTPKRLRRGVVAEAGDVVQYREELA